MNSAAVQPGLALGAALTWAFECRGGGISCTSQCSEWGAVRAIRIDVLSMREVRDKLECLVASP